MSRKQLILDAGGVIVTNLTPGFWETIAARSGSGRSHASLKMAFAAEIRDEFWCGALPETGFWRWLRAYCPDIAEQEAKEILLRNVRPLPAFRCIPAWSEQADVHLLSNHRAEWLAPCLERLRPYLGHIVISSEAGALKPYDAIFERLHKKLDAFAPILYVDDQAKNIAAAERTGWHALRADERGDWIRHANEWLHKE